MCCDIVGTNLEWRAVRVALLDDALLTDQDETGLPAKRQTGAGAENCSRRGLLVGVLFKADYQNAAWKGGVPCIGGKKEMTLSQTREG